MATISENQNGVKVAVKNVGIPDKAKVNIVLKSNRSEGGHEKSGCRRLVDWINCHIYLFPIITAVYITVSFFITYGIAVSYGHVEAGFPYISYTGVRPPERGWFSQLNRSEGGHEKSGCRRLVDWINCHIYLFPVITAVYITISFFITYGIAVSYGHVEAGFPYISYTGVRPPERGWFSQLVNIAAIMMSINVYIRYLILSRTMKLNNLSLKHRHGNNLSLAFGWLSAFGLSMVANFQTVDMRPLHHTGAGLAFGFGFFYCWTQSVLTWELRLVDECSYYRQVAIQQFVLSSVLTVFLIIFGVTKIIYKKGRHDGLGTKWDTLRVPYLFSTITEWLTALMGCAVFTLTFIPDFKRFRLHGPSVELKQDCDMVESQLFIPNPNCDKLTTEVPVNQTDTSDEIVSTQNNIQNI